MVGVDRRKRGPDPHLDWKVRLFFAGALLAVAGIALESSLLVVAAIVTLFVGFALRFFRPGGQGSSEKWREPPDDEED